MRISNGRLLFSASDLMRFIGCAHATKLDLDHLQGRAPVPRADTADEPLIEDLGALKAALLTARLALHPERPVGTGVIAEALHDVITDQGGARAYRAVHDLLSPRA